MVKQIKGIIWLLLIGAVAFTSIDAQTLQPQDDIQSWDELQVTVPLSGQFDFFTSVAGRFGKNITRLNDARYTIGYTWKAHKSFSVSPFYTFIRVRNSSGRFRNEHRIQLRGVYRFLIKSFGLSHRSQFEWRLRRPANTWRYRPSLTFEKEIPEKFIQKAKFYITEEPFYDSATKKFSRNRFTVGITKTLTKSLSVDLYFMRQNDGFSRPGDLSVIGTTWKVKL